jgi:hypothetical protein
MREITGAVELCFPGGRLRPEAAGFTRTPLHSTAALPSGVRGLWRSKRWEHWGIVSDRLLLGLTIADLDYASVLQAYVHDRSTGETVAHHALKAFADAEAAVVPDSRPPFRSTGTIDGLRLRFDEQSDGRVVIWLQSDRAQAVLEVAPGGESLGVVVPWSQRRYQYTLKDVGRPVTGTVMLDGETVAVDGGGAHATLDRGRGRWPYSARWNWAAGAGTDDAGHRLGLQLGGRWTDGTGATENALLVDGRLHHFDGELEFRNDPSEPTAPWTVGGDWIDAVLTPFHVREATTPGLLVSSRTVQAFGTWSGSARLPDGRRFVLDGLTGWSEDAANRW